MAVPPACRASTRLRASPAAAAAAARCRRSAIAAGVYVVSLVSLCWRRGLSVHGLLYILDVPRPPPTSGKGCWNRFMRVLGWEICHQGIFEILEREGAVRELSAASRSYMDATTSTASLSLSSLVVHLRQTLPQEQHAALDVAYRELTEQTATASSVSLAALWCLLGVILPLILCRALT